jgi:transcriptional regulator of acetoin/glycerol metabolism
MMTPVLKFADLRKSDLFASTRRLAEGKTMFLVKIGELPAETESALLRALPQRKFERVGGNQTIPGLTLSFSNS